MNNRFSSLNLLKSVIIFSRFYFCNIKAEKQVIQEGLESLVKQEVKEETEQLAKKEIKEIIKDSEQIVKSESTSLKNTTEATQKIEYKEVEIVDKQGRPVGEFDKIEKDLFVEEKSAKGMNTLHPKTGKPIQTPEGWAKKQIYDKSVTRIENLQNVAVGTRSTASGSKTIPSLNDIKKINKLEFRIDGDTPELRRAVEKSMKDLTAKYPNWTFTATFGK